MAIIQVMTMVLSSGQSSTASVDLGSGEFQRMAIAFPTTNPLAAAADITAQASYDSGTTWKDICYSNSPNTATSSLLPWGASRSSFGNVVMCEAALFAKNNFRLKFGSAATTSADFLVILGKD